MANYTLSMYNKRTYKKQSIKQRYINFLNKREKDTKEYNSDYD